MTNLSPKEAKLYGALLPAVCQYLDVKYDHEKNAFTGDNSGIIISVTNKVIANISEIVTNEQNQD